MTFLWLILVLKYKTCLLRNKHSCSYCPRGNISWRLVFLRARGSRSIKIDIGKLISINKLILNNIDFIGQSITIDHYRIDKNHPVSVVGAFDYNSFECKFQWGQ